MQFRLFGRVLFAPPCRSNGIIRNQTSSEVGEDVMLLWRDWQRNDNLKWQRWREGKRVEQQVVDNPIWQSFRNVLIWIGYFGMDG